MQMGEKTGNKFVSETAAAAGIHKKTAFGHNWQPGNREEHAAERNSGTAVLF